MNETKFTPGPWYADIGGQIWRRNPDELYENGGGVAGERPLASTYRGWNEERETGYPKEANAHLIAAAPDLYKALAHLEPYLDAIVCYASTIEEHPPNGFILETKAALAKARGEG